MMSVYPTGVTIFDPEKAYCCYTLFDGRDGKSHLVDMNGVERKQWNYLGFPTEMLAPDLKGGIRGNVLVQLSGRPVPGPIKYDNLFNNQEIGEVDWAGKVVWRWGLAAPEGAASQNCDWDRLADGNTLIISTLARHRPQFASHDVEEEIIREIDPAGKIVWEYAVTDHLHEYGLDQAGLDLIFAQRPTGVLEGGYLSITSLHGLGPNKWHDGGDDRFDPSHILLGSREANFVVIISKKIGGVVWRLGPTYAETGVHESFRVYDGRVPRPVDQISGIFDAHMIPPGLPGTGNILLVDNQAPSGLPPIRLGMFHGSRVLEIDPVRNEIVWQYSGATSERDVWTFGTSFLGSARRLPNGNTLINEGMHGRLFQVTREGEIVWEYINPYFSTPSITDGVVKANWVYRAQPVPYDWVPEATGRSEIAVRPPELETYRIPA